MIRLTRVSRLIWLVEYRGKLIRITDNYPARKHRDRITRMRYVICKATHLNSTQFRFIGNVRISGQWVTEWAVV